LSAHPFPLPEHETDASKLGVSGSLAVPVRNTLNGWLIVSVIDIMRIHRRAAIGIIALGSAFGQVLSFQTSSVKSSRAAGTRGSVQLKSERLTGTNVTLKQLLRFAYGLQDPQISGPAWIDSEGYDVEAKPESATSPAQLRLMLLTLLTDRFKLKAHSENREMPVYWLVVAEGGPKLRDPKEEEAFNAARAGKPTFRSGFAGMFTNKDLPEFAERLSRGIGRTVVDKTGIKGRYWFQLEWAADHEQPGVASPSLLVAMTEQLGLKLEEHTESIEVLIIDHAEMPSEK
jgi:uncharacterized protein (TIGR03435 family)